MPEPLADPNVRLLALVDLLLVLKMIVLGNYTSFLRLRRQVYATPEDYALGRRRRPRDRTRTSSACGARTATTWRTSSPSSW
jgi:hypothetical protein